MLNTNNTKRGLKIFSFCVLLGLSVFSNTAMANEIIQGSARVIDGDTILIDKAKIRLEGIDAPEKAQFCVNKTSSETIACGVMSRKVLKDITGGKRVYCNISGIDKYNRMLGRCFTEDNIDINLFMVKSGWAVSYNRNKDSEFHAAEQEAKTRNLGIWNTNFILPENYRRSWNNKF